MERLFWRKGTKSIHGYVGTYFKACRLFVEDCISMHDKQQLKLSAQTMSTVFEIGI